MSDRSNSLHYEAVEFMPETKLPGVLYVSERFNLAIHLCACGCDNETVTPLHGDGWTLTDGPTLRPSIGNTRMCGAHYFVTDGKIEWL